MAFQLVRDVSVFAVIILSVAVFCGCVAEVTNPVANANFYLDKKWESQFVKAMTEFAEKENLQLRGEGTQFGGNGGTKRILRMNLSLYRNDSLIVSVVGGNLGEYSAAGYAKWDPMWESVWNGFLLYLRRSLGDAIKIEFRDVPPDRKIEEKGSSASKRVTS